ncbi:MAG: transposase [Thermodesulfobacteriota bacterium]
MKQLDLFQLETLPPTVKYDLVFEALPSLPLQPKERGRPPFSRDALLKAFIYKALRRLKTLSDLTFEFYNNPIITQSVGFDPYKAPPSIERFSEFLRETPHPLLENIRIRLVQQALEEKVISGKHLVMDSCPIIAKVRENNLKTSLSKNRFDKTHIPKGDPDARLGILIHFPQPSKKQIRYFWGYRNHIVADAEEELPLWEITHPANVSEVHPAIPMLQKTKETFSLPIETVNGDANYDSEKILSFIINDLKAQPIIPRNPRTQQSASYTLKGDTLYCQADLPLYRKGKMTVKRTAITYLQYCCPIHFGKERQKYLFCPAFHPNFINQKGCNVLIRLSPSIREQIDYGSITFKQVQKKRSSVERVFSRLLSIAMQEPPVTGITAIRNYCTIAHITVLLVALAANRSGHHDKIRFVRSFVPNFLS